MTDKAFEWVLRRMLRERPSRWVEGCILGLQVTTSSPETGLRAVPTPSRRPFLCMQPSNIEIEH